MTTTSSNHDDLSTLEAQRQQLEAQALKAAADISRVVIKDLPRFLERETRWRWVRQIAFATSMSDEQILAIKAGLSTLNAELTPTLKAQLAEDTIWLNPVTHQSDDDKTLALNKEVWSVLQGIADRLSGFLSTNGFPSDPDGTQERPYNLQYRTPTYFLDGHYCPRLIETYWSHMAHLKQINGEIESIHNEAARTQLEARWNSVK